MDWPFLSFHAVRYAVEAQNRIIQKTANNGSCVIVGRVADYVLRGYDNVSGYSSARLSISVSGEWERCTGTRRREPNEISAVRTGRDRRITGTSPAENGERRKTTI